MQKMVLLISMGVGVNYAEYGTLDMNGGGSELCRIWYF